MMNHHQDDWETKMPAEFRNELSAIRSSVAPAESMKRFMLAAQDVESTVAAMKRKSFIANLLAISVCAVVVMGTAWLIAWSQATVLVASIIIAYVFSTMGFAWGLIRGIRDQRVAGAILMDCGRMKSKRLVLLLFAFLPLTIILMTAVDFQTTPWHYWVGGVALCAPMAIYFTSMATGRLQVRTNGIWHYIGFLPWHEIQSWGWTGESESTLLIVKNRRWLFSRRGALHVPIDLKEQVDEYLRQYCVATPKS